MTTLTLIANDVLAVEVASFGAEMRSLTSSDGRQWLWNGDPAVWSGTSPILFPIVGKAPDNRVTINGQAFEMNQHGFARRSEFRLAESSATHCIHELEASDTSLAAYPFKFRLSLEHRIDDRTLTVAATVANLDSQTIPFGIGFHSAFVWPLPDAQGDAHMIVLDNAGEPALARLEGGLLKPLRLPSPFARGRLMLDHAMFEDDAMIFPQGAGGGLTYAAENGPALQFRFENLPNLALWTKPGAPYICIEPWHGTAPETGAGDDIAARPSTVMLPEGRTARFAYQVDIPI